MQKRKCIVYIGDFDFRNENVQSHLVKNNGKVLKKIGYDISFIGINRECTELSDDEFNKKKIYNVGDYFELPNTLNLKGIFKYNIICSKILTLLEKIASERTIEYVITYQAPTYSAVLKKIITWCANNQIKYIVNCADLPIFSMQPIIKRMVMSINWKYMHYVNKKYSDGIIAVSTFVEKFYFKENRKSIVIPPLFDQKDILCQKQNNEESVPIFLYAGCPFATKNHKIKTSSMKDRLDYIIDLFAELDKKRVDFQFIIIGISKADYLKCVPRHKETLKFTHKIEFRGRENHNETMRQVALADFTINYRDKSRMTEAGMSTKIVESISVGTPVIINNTSDTFKYLEEGITGFELKNNFNADTKKIYELCQLSKEQREKLKCKCYKSRIFDIETYVTRFENFLKDL